MACREDLGLAPLTAETSRPTNRLAALQEVLEAHIRMVKLAASSAASGARLVVLGNGDSLKTDMLNALGGESACVLQRRAGHAGRGLSEAVDWQ